MRVISKHILPTFTRPRGVRASSILAWRADADMLAGALLLISMAASLAYIWVACPLDLAPDEAHYWSWSQQLDWSYYSKGPLVAWLIRGSCELFGSLSLALTGDLAAAVRMPAVLCHGLMLAGWYTLAFEIYRSSRIGLTVMVCAVTLPLVRAGAILMTIDPPLMACWCWALVFLHRALLNGRRWNWLAAGVLTAFGVLAKFTMVLLPAALVLFLMVQRRAELRRGGVWLFLFVGMSGWLPILLWNYQHEWVSFRHVFGQVGGAGERSGGIQWLGPLTFLISQAGMMLGLWIVVYLLALWRFRPHAQTNPGVQLLWWSSAPIWLLFAGATLLKPGQPNWPAPAYVSGLVLAVVWFWEQLEGASARAIRICLYLGLPASLFTSFLLLYPQVVRPLLAELAGPPTPTEPLSIRQIDMTARLAGWRALAREVDRVRRELQDETNLEPILAGTHWTIPGELQCYCEGHPNAFTVGIPNRSDRHSQFDLWRPNPISDAQVFLGQTFLIVGDIGPDVLQAFDFVEQPISVVHTEQGVPLAGWRIWICHGFRGFQTVMSHNPGY